MKHVTFNNQDYQDYFPNNRFINLFSWFVTCIPLHLPPSIIAQRSKADQLGSHRS